VDTIFNWSNISPNHPVNSLLMIVGSIACLEHNNGKSIKSSLVTVLFFANWLFLLATAPHLSYEGNVNALYFVKLAGCIRIPKSNKPLSNLFAISSALPLYMCKLIFVYVVWIFLKI